MFFRGSMSSACLFFRPRLETTSTSLWRAHFTALSKNHTFSKRLEGDRPETHRCELCALASEPQGSSFDCWGANLLHAVNYLMGARSPKY